MYKQLLGVILVAAMLVLCGFLVVAGSAPSANPVDLAQQHLVEVMDRYHQDYFEVYEDVGSAGNHFVRRAMTGSDVTIDDAHTGTVHSGATAIRNTFTARGDNWGGWVFQNGVLVGNDVAPRDNWGDYPDAGYDLSGATQITFWVRGATGGERVEFFASGVGRSGDAAVAPYPDSSPKNLSENL